MLWTAAVAAFALDQWSKHFVFSVLGLEIVGNIDVLPPLLVLRRGYNTGVNFGLFADSAIGQRWLLIAISVALCVALWIWARRSFLRPLEFASAGLVIGGAMGNVLDRLLFPGVRDFLNMSCCGIDNPYVFNVADVCIFLGAVGLVVFGPPHKGRKKAP